MRLKEDELERSDERAGIRINWADAREVLTELLLAAGVRPSRETIGRIRFVGDGLSNVVYGGSIQRVAGQDEDVVVKLPSRYAGPERDVRLRIEAALLRYLGDQPLPFRVPRPIDEIQTEFGLAVVQEWVAGMEVDMRATRFPGKPWEVVGRVAAAVHAVDPAPLRELIPAHATRRAHAQEFASLLQELDEPEARDTEAWMREHLPPTTPSCLLHGDLLGQNLRVSLDGDHIAVLDWGEACLGDPAYDLAIVTRGVRKPFATADGLWRLLDAYNALAATPLTAQDVRLYEVILCAHLYDAVARESGRGSPHAEQQRNVWRSILRRAGGAEDR